MRLHAIIGRVEDIIFEMQDHRTSAETTLALRRLQEAYFWLGEALQKEKEDARWPAPPPAVAP